MLSTRPNKFYLKITHCWVGFLWHPLLTLCTHMEVRSTNTSYSQDNSAQVPEHRAQNGEMERCHLFTCVSLTWNTPSVQFSSVQFSSVQSLSSIRLCDSMNRSTPGLPVHHQLPEFTQTHVHRVRDAIQPSHPRSSPSPPAPNPSQHQSLCQWVNSSHEVAKVLEFQLQHHSFQRNSRADLLQNGLVGSSCSPRDSQESSPTSQFESS